MNPMAIENFSDKMEFQGRGAAHIHGVAWCNLEKVSKVLNLEMLMMKMILKQIQKMEMKMIPRMSLKIMLILILKQKVT